GAADRLGLVQPRSLARRRVPRVALHLAVSTRHRRRREAEARRRVLALEPVRRRVGVTRLAIEELRAFGVRDQRVLGERRRFSAARELDLFFRGEVVTAGIREVEIRQALDEGARLREARVGTGRGDAL